MIEPPDVALIIKGEWEQRARSPHREFFVASHEGWNTDEGRAHQARIDASAVLTSLDPAVLRGFDVLEVGCGSGRLVPSIAPLVRSYTGFDISPTMVEVARAACRSFANARFFEADGTDIPVSAQDTDYDLAFSLAVFIHCPKGVCESLASATMRGLKPGGQFRVQLLADPDDLEGITPGADTGMRDRAARVETSAVSSEVRDMIVETHYRGHRFGYREAKAWLEDLGHAQTVRLDPIFIYGIVDKRPPA